MNLASAYGLLAYALIFAALVTQIRFEILHSRAGLLATIVALAVGIAPSMHGILGLPSGTLLLLSITHLAYPHYKFPEIVKIKFWVLVSFVIFAILFYILALQIISINYINVNLYNYGYEQNALGMILILLLAGGILYYYKLYDFWILAIIFDISLWKFGIYNNLLDALFCVPLWVVSVFILIKEIIIKIKIKNLVKQKNE